MSQGLEFSYPLVQDAQSFAAVLPALQQRSPADGNGGLDARLAALQALSDDLLRGAPELAGTPGVAFLAGFLRRSNLEHLLARELPNVEALDHFVPVDTRKSLRILPKGLACHWIAGNVPMLGMFSWSLSSLVGNANVVRLSSRQEDFISPLLARLAGLSDAGRQMAERTAIVHFDRDNLEAHRQMSEAADVRIAWGGQEAVQAIKQLPSRWECDDIVLGPRVSCAVVDPKLATDRMLDRLATDIVYFDQLACSSPQCVFTKGERGDAEFDAFVERLSEAMARQAQAIARHPLGFSETYQILLDRTRTLFGGGTLHRDAQTEWTVAVADAPQSEVVCANRFVQVVPFQTFQSVYPHLPTNVQTAITLLSGEEMVDFTHEASHYGVCRFPRPGEGNLFEDPWDGIPLISRLTRWILRSESRE